MTTRFVEQDDRYLWSALGTADFTVGRYYMKSQDGANRAEGEPFWYPHPYVMTLVDSGIGVYRELALAGSCTTEYYPDGGYDSPLYVSGQMSRPWTSNDDIALHNKFRDKFDDASFNTPVFAGELGETTDMLADRVRQLAQVGKAVKKGNLKKAAKLLGSTPPRSPKGRRGGDPDKPYLRNEQTVTSGWLELQYGWQPLLSDIADLADAISKQDQPRKQKISASHWIGKVGSCSRSCASISGWGKYRKVLTGYINEVLPSFGDRLGLHDPASIAWELLPFSFVADWFIPIGNYLEARGIASRAEGTFVLTTFDRHNFHVDSLSNCSTRWCLGPPQQQLLAWDIRVNLTREVYPVYPQISLPVFRNELSSSQKRLANAVALVREVFGSTTSRRV